MKREIKFRAWDLEKSKMVYVLNMELDFNRDLHHAVITSSPTEVGERRHNCDDLVFMQFTGLKDKNGREIYEGDIIRAGDGEKSLVEWVKGCVVARHYRDGESQDCDFIASRNVFEIIGNIYENSELLK